MEIPLYMQEYRNHALKNLLWGSKQATRSNMLNKQTNKNITILCCKANHAANLLTLLHSERPKLYTILAFLSAIKLIFNDPENASICKLTEILMIKH